MTSARRRPARRTRQRHARRPARPIALAIPLLALASGCVSLHVFDGRIHPLVETVIHGESGPKILLLDIEGVISEAAEDRGLLGGERDGSVARVREQLDRARQDPTVSALLLRINSPGGTATASDLIYQEILRFKRERSTPVVAQLMGMATSGGYYVAMAADEVIAQPTTVTGSIGVIFVGVNFSGLMQKLGIENQTISAGAHKEAGSPLRRMTSEERAHIQSILDDLHARFKQIVAAGRPDLDAGAVDALADGSIFSAAQAQRSGLVDRIGDLETAVQAAQRRADLATAQVVTYHRPREWRQNLYTREPLAPPSLKLEILPSSLLNEGPAFLYLWAPGAS